MIYEQERKEPLKQYRKELKAGRIDREFLPYLDALLKLSFIVPWQSCIGHMPCSCRVVDAPGRWGYFHFCTDFDFYEYLELKSEITNEKWLWLPGCQFPVMGANEPLPSEYGGIVLAFAWKAEEWPKPMEWFMHTVQNYQNSTRRPDEQSQQPEEGQQDPSGASRPQLDCRSEAQRAPQA